MEKLIEKEYRKLNSRSTRQQSGLLVSNTLSGDLSDHDDSPSLRHGVSCASLLVVTLHVLLAISCVELHTYPLCSLLTFCLHRS